MSTATTTSTSSRRPASHTPNVGWIRDGEYLTYTANIATAGAYTMTARVASPNTGRTAALSVDGSSAVTFTVPNTGSYAAFQTVSLPVTLPAGTHTLKLTFQGDGQNIDWIAFAAVATPTPTPPRVNPPSMMPGTIPGMIQAEDFNSGGEGVGYYDTTAGNSGGAYRQQEDVDIETGNGITNVGWIRPGEWLKYTVNVRTTGDYDVAVRVSSPQSNTQMRMQVDGVTATTFTVPNTGSYETYTNVTQKVRLTYGPHIVRLVFSGYHNIDWIAFATGTVTIPPTTVITTSVPSAGASFVAVPTTAPHGSAVKFTVTPASGKSISAAWWSFDAPAHLNTWNSRAINPTFFYPTAGTFSPLVKLDLHGRLDRDRPADRLYHGDLTIPLFSATASEPTSGCDGTRAAAFPDIPGSLPLRCSPARGRADGAPPRRAAARHPPPAAPSAREIASGRVVRPGERAGRRSASVTARPASRPICAGIFRNIYRVLNVSVIIARGVTDPL